MVIVTTLQTPNNLLKQLQNSLVLRYSRTVRGLDKWDTRELALPRICILFWIPPKNPNLNQATQKSTCQKFSYPKSKLSNPKKSFEHPCHLKSGVHPPPPPRGLPDSIELLHSTFSCSSVTSSLTWLTICEWSARFPALNSFTEI